MDTGAITHWALNTFVHFMSSSGAYLQNKVSNKHWQTTFLSDNVKNIIWQTKMENKFQQKKEIKKYFICIIKDKNKQNTQMFFLLLIF